MRTLFRLCGTVVLLAMVTGCQAPVQPPVAEFVWTPESARVGVELVFDGSASYAPSGEIMSYAWDFGDGNTAEGVTASHAYEEPGRYTVNLAVRDDRGNEGQTEQFVDVAPDGPPTPPPPGDLQSSRAPGRDTSR